MSSYELEVQCTPTVDSQSLTCPQVHCSDIGNPGKPKDLSMNFAARITCEFLAQGALSKLQWQAQFPCGAQRKES